MNNYSHNQIFIQNTYCSFLESKKNGILRLPHSASPSQDDRGDASPKPRRPWRSGARGQQKAITKGFCEILAQNLFFCLFVFCVA